MGRGVARLALAAVGAVALLDRSGAPHDLAASSTEAWYERWLAGGGRPWDAMDAYERRWAKVVAAARAAPPDAAPARRRVFVIVAVQRTGSTWLVRELDRHPCLRVGAEVFLDVKATTARNREFAWTGAGQFAAIAGLVDARVGADDRVSAAAPVGGRYDRLRRRCARLEEGACGFKWMASQRFAPYYDAWFGRTCAENDVGLLFLTRENPLRVVVSMADKQQGQDSQRVSKARGLRVWTGAELLGRLDRVRGQYDALDRIRANATARGIRTMATTYEANVADPDGTLDRVVEFALGGEPCAARGGFSFARASTKRRSRRSVKVHPKAMASFVENWADVVATLRGTRYEHLLAIDGSEGGAARGAAR